MARLLARCAEDGAPAGTYNAGTGIESAVAMVVRALAWRLGRTDLIDLGALPYRGSEVMRYVLDATRAKERLGFVAEGGAGRGARVGGELSEEQVGA